MRPARYRHARLTARTADAEKRLAKTNGFRYYIAKPYDPDLVLALLAQLKTKL